MAKLTIVQTSLDPEQGPVGAALDLLVTLSSGLVDRISSSGCSGSRRRR